MTNATKVLVLDPCLPETEVFGVLVNERSVVIYTEMIDLVEGREVRVEVQGSPSEPCHRGTLRVRNGFAGVVLSQDCLAPYEKVAVVPVELPLKDAVEIMRDHVTQWRSRADNDDEPYVPDNPVIDGPIALICKVIRVCR